MVEAVRKHIDAAGVEPVGFYYERFALSGTGAAARAEVPAEPEVVRRTRSAGRGCPAAAPSAHRQAVEVAAVLTGPDGRVGGRTDRVWPRKEIPPLVGVAVAASPSDEAATARAIAGQPVARAGSDVPVIPLDPDGDLIESGEARSVAGQQVLARTDIAPLVEPHYMIGEEHPSVLSSDAVFDAREALELGALELTIGRMTSRQLTGYRLLAESTVPYVEGDRFVDAAAYTETNAAFHDYLFNMTGNEHLLQAYNNLGVKGRMHEVLRHATWCDPRVAQDHLDIVSAFEAGDRAAARRLISEHADRSKLTMRRAMDAEPRPRAAEVVQPRPVRRQDRRGHRRRAGHRADGGQADRRGGGRGGPRRPVGTGASGSRGDRGRRVPRHRGHRGPGNLGRCRCGRRAG